MGSFSLIVLALVIGVASAATVEVSLGATNSVSFQPSQVTINPGDDVKFVFLRPGDSGTWRILLFNSFFSFFFSFFFLFFLTPFVHSL
jgi:hypothetical protein